MIAKLEVVLDCISDLQSEAWGALRHRPVVPSRGVVTHQFGNCCSLYILKTKMNAGGKGEDGVSDCGHCAFLAYGFLRAFGRLLMETNRSNNFSF